MPSPTLLELLMCRFPDTPRTRLKQWIEHGRVRVEGRVVRRATQPIEKPDARIELVGRAEQAHWFRPEWRIHPKLALLYLDTSVAVVDKGAGLLAIPASGRGHSAMAVLGAFMTGGKYGQRLPPLYRTLRPQPVHRLDQFTTGVLCFAMNPDARARLIAQFSQHTAGRDYIAYVHGRAPAHRGVWRHLLRFDEDKLLQRVVGHGCEAPRRAGTVAAVTHYEVMEEYPTPDGMISKLRLRLETGRTHQIRVQAAEERMPLIGDRTYHGLYRIARRETVHLPVVFNRQALHAAELQIEHPDQPGKRVTFHAPLPDDLRELEHQLRRLGGRHRAGPGQQRQF